MLPVPFPVHAVALEQRPIVYQTSLVRHNARKV